MKTKFYKIVGPIFLLIFIIAVALSCRDEEFVPLKINSVSPAEVLIGDTVTIFGEGFSPDYQSNAIFFNGIETPVNPVKGSTTTKLVVPVPDGASTGSIRVNILDDEIFDSPSLTVKTPIFEKLIPNKGYVGDTIKIKGENFRSDGNRNHVRFYNPTNKTLTAEVISSTSTEIQVIVPEYAQPGNISVLGFQGPKFNFKEGEITRISPDHGMVGDTISILGIGLIPDATFFFNPGVASVSAIEGFTKTSREIKVIVPEGTSNGRIKMTYSLDQRQVTVVSDSTFKIYPSVTGLSSPNGPPGYILTINGHSFSPRPTVNIVTVLLNGVVSKVKRFDNNSIEVAIPVGATSGPLTVSVNGRIANGPVFQVTEESSPVITGLSKTSGYVGDEITITGQNFSTSGNNIVTFATDIIATIVSSSATAVVVTVPAGAITGNITISADGSANIPGPKFTVKTLSELPFKINEVTPVTVVQGSTITIKGSNFSTAGDIDVYITESFGSGVSYLLDEQFLNISATQITAKIESFSDPGNGFPRLIYALGDYKVSIRYKTSSAEDASTTKIIKIEGAAPIIESITPSANYAGDTVRIAGKNFNGTDINHTVKFNDTPATIVSPDDGDPLTVKVKVPDLNPGVYNVTLTTSEKTSPPIAFTVQQRVVSADPIKPVYYISTGTGFSVNLNKLTTASTAPTLVFKATEGMTAMVVHLANNPADSRVYFSESNSSTVGKDGIFSMKLNGTAKTRIIKTPFSEDDDISYGFLVTDLSLDAVNNRLFWSTAPSGVEILTGKINDNPIKVPQLLSSLDSKFYLASGLTYLADDGKLYFSAAYDDAVSFETVSQLFMLDLSSASNKPEPLFAPFVGLINDVKIDPVNSKVYLLASNSVGSTVILKGNLDGSGVLATFKDLGNSTQLFGISLDLKDFYIYWSQFKNGKGSIVRALLSAAPIPGTQPPVTEQTVYDNLDIHPGSGAGAIAVEEPTKGGAAQRIRASMNMQLKYRLKKLK